MTSKINLDPLHVFESKERRTLGDGMDSSLINVTEVPKNVKLHLNRIHINTATFKPVEVHSPKIALVPKFIPKERKQPKYLIKKQKEPKFIPYEPYKGAIEPIVPPKPKENPVKVGKSKNNVELQTLVAQMSQMRMEELSKTLETKEFKAEETVLKTAEWEKAKTGYENDIKNLRETNAHLENQLKFQAQVNSELKTLLVAAVGEDLETRVQHLTEDKLQLARALLKSANHLTSHQEQTEWLSGQCEVWRSKFLASSLMVEELARWKSALSTRINDLQEAIKGLLEDQYRCQRMSLKTYSSIDNIAAKLAISLREEELNSCNLLEINQINCKLSHAIKEALNIDEDEDALLERCSRLDPHTNQEKLAMRLLQNPVSISNKQDAICNALRGTAMALNEEHVHFQHPLKHATCCSHCTGDMKNI